MRNNDIEALSDVEHVRQRPAMYIGSVDCETHERWILGAADDSFERRRVVFVPGVLKLLDEIISNSVDEFIRTDGKHATKIDVEIDQHSISVEDNGRGIPSKRAAGGVETTMAEIALTKLRTGSNFHNEKFVSIGTHGLGASLVNIMSTRFDAWTDDGNARLRVECRNGMAEKKVRRSKSKKLGTHIRFWPDWQLFGCSDISDDLLGMIKKRIFDLAICYPDIRFRINKARINSKSFPKYAEMFSADAICMTSEKFKVAVFPSEDPAHISFVNGIDTYEGGTHLDYIRNNIVSTLLERLAKKHKKLGLKPSDIKSKIAIILISNEIKNPKFRSQTKEYISNPAAELHPVFKSINDPVHSGKFYSMLLKSHAIIDPIIETKKLRLAAADRVALNKASRQLKKIKVTKHISANGDPARATLFITEGDSASVPFTSARDADLHGCFPLRGKPLNSWSKKPADIMKNKELSELMAIIGLRFDSKPGDALNYQNIRIMADADYDGYAITSLMIAFFFRWPWLFEQGRIGITRCPIMIATYGRQSKRIYDLREYDKLRSAHHIDDKWDIKYFKGLGSLTAPEYELMLNSPVEDILRTTPASQYKLELGFGSDADARKAWLRDNGK